MWIELPDEIIEYTKKIEDPFDKSIIVINTLFDSMLKQQHIIYASDNVLGYLMNNELLSLTNRKFIEWIRQQYIYVYECYEMVNYKIVITLDSEKLVRRDDIFYTPLSFLYELREAKLLTENETDAFLFQNIYEHVAKRQKMSPNYDIRFENDAFHGGNAPSKLQQAATENRIMICLIDSDKDFCKAASGATYRGANNKYKRIKNNHIVYMRQLEVREKENLFSPNIYLMILEQNKELLQILQSEACDENAIRYFDIKDGVKYKNISQLEWKQYYEKILLLCKEKGAYIEPPEELIEKDEFICIKGIGARQCDEVNVIMLGNLEECDEKMDFYAFDEEKRKTIYEARKTVLEQLPKCLQEEWYNIFKLLFSWGCCLSQKSLPMYGMD